ncbi:MAG: hypothetical protein RL497_1382 [Pseudomonadota bacterium]
MALAAPPALIATTKGNLPPLLEEEELEELEEEELLEELELLDKPPLLELDELEVLDDEDELDEDEEELEEELESPVAVQAPSNSDNTTGVLQRVSRVDVIVIMIPPVIVYWL